MIQIHKTSRQLIFLHLFTTYADGSMPYAGVILDPTGNLYGTASFNGAGGQGVLYTIILSN